VVPSGELFDGGVDGRCGFQRFQSLLEPGFEAGQARVTAVGHHAVMHQHFAQVFQAA